MTSQSKKVLRAVGFVVGVALLGAAIAAIVRSAPTLDQLRAVIARPDGWLIAWAVAATIGNLVGASGMFYALVRTFGRIGFFEMGKVIPLKLLIPLFMMRLRQMDRRTWIVITQLMTFGP